MRASVEWLVSAPTPVQLMQCDTSMFRPGNRSRNLPAVIGSIQSSPPPKATEADRFVRWAIPWWERPGVVERHCPHASDPELPRRVIPTQPRTSTPGLPRPASPARGLPPVGGRSPPTSVSCTTSKAFDNRSIDASSAPVMGRPLKRLQKHLIILR